MTKFQRGDTVLFCTGFKRMDKREDFQKGFVRSVQAGKHDVHQIIFRIDKKYYMISNSVLSDKIRTTRMVLVEKMKKSVIILSSPA